MSNILLKIRKDPTAPWTKSPNRACRAKESDLQRGKKQTTHSRCTPINPRKLTGSLYIFADRTSLDCLPSPRNKLWQRFQNMKTSILSAESSEGAISLQETTVGPVQNTVYSCPHARKQCRLPDPRQSCAGFQEFKKLTWELREKVVPRKQRNFTEFDDASDSSQIAGGHAGRNGSAKSQRGVARECIVDGYSSLHGRHSVLIVDWIGTEDFLEVSQRSALYPYLNMSQQVSIP